jgi:hypothetical protein
MMCILAIGVNSEKLLSRDGMIRRALLGRFYSPGENARSPAPATAARAQQVAALFSIGLDREIVSGRRFPRYVAKLRNMKSSLGSAGAANICAVLPNGAAKASPRIYSSSHSAGQRETIYS